MKLWITGAKGLVAKAVQELCLEENIPFVATTRQQVDISSAHQLKKFMKSREAKNLTHIVNCAAYTAVDQAEIEQEKAFLMNALGPENLASIARDFHLQLIHLSTDYVFGIEGDKLFVETDPCQPENIYAKTKYAGENRVLETYPRACILRTSWVFGKGGRNFISTLFEKIQSEEKIYVVKDQLNRLTYAKDLAKAILSLLCHCGIFHFANQGVTSRFEIALKMIALGKEKKLPIVCREVIATNVSNFSNGAKRPMNSALDTTKVETLLGIKPRPWDLALKDFIYDF